MSRAVANTLLPAKRPASTIARPRPRELPVTNHTCAIQSSYLASPSYFETARAAGNTVQQEIAIACPAERRAIQKLGRSRAKPPLGDSCLAASSRPSINFALWRAVGELSSD